MERPVLDFEGQQFIRQNGAWVTSSRVRVPAVMGARLDSVAKANQSLWHRCVEQDVTDRTYPQGHQAGVDATGRRHVNSLGGFECKFDGDRTLVVDADLRRNWSERKNSWGFWGNERLPALNGHDLRVQLTVLSPQADPPELEPAEGEVDGIRHQVNGYRISLTIALFDSARLFNPVLRWGETQNGKPMVFRDSLPLRLRSVGNTSSGWNRPYRYNNFLLVVQPPEPKPAPFYLEWSKRFFPGGLPSLGKRHS
jgi:hypothetical protein